MLEAWSRAFVLTLLIEGPIVVCGFQSVSLSRRFAIFLLANVLTHPALWFVFPRFEPYALWLLVAETCVIVVEWRIYANSFRRVYSWRYALMMSLGANATSTALGLLLRHC